MNKGDKFIGVRPEVQRYPDGSVGTILIPQFENTRLDAISDLYRWRLSEEFRHSVRMIGRVLAISGFVVFLAIAMAASTVRAQQDVGSPSSFALQINGAVAQLAQRAEFAERQVQQLSAEVKRLRDKYEPQPSPPEPKKD